MFQARACAPRRPQRLRRRVWCAGEVGGPDNAVIVLPKQQQFAKNHKLTVPHPHLLSSMYAVPQR